MRDYIIRFYYIPSGENEMTALRALEASPTAPEQDRNSAVFTALSDPTRRAIVERLSDGPMTVGDLSAPFSVSAPAISRHLKVLEAAGIVTRTVDRQWRVCTLQIRSLQDARKWLDRVLPAND